MTAVEVDLASSSDSSEPSHFSLIRRWVQQVGSRLPVPGPVTSFPFLNPLHGYEDLTFDEGLLAGARQFGCEPYPLESWYRQHLSSGRIRTADLQSALQEELSPSACDERIATLLTRGELWLALLTNPLPTGTPDELRWYLAETDALRRMNPALPEDLRRRWIDSVRRWGCQQFVELAQNKNEHDDGWKRLIGDLVNRQTQADMERWREADWEEFGLKLLWRVIRQGVHAARTGECATVTSREHDLPTLLQQTTGVDPRAMVDRLLIRFCAAFLDQGQARERLPVRGAGFWEAFLTLYGTSSPWQLELTELPGELRRLVEANLSPLASIHESLQWLNIPSDDREAYLLQTAVRLRGWAGMLWHAETRHDRVPFPVPADTLLEFLAVRLIVERVAIQHVAAREWGVSGNLTQIRDVAARHPLKHESESLEQTAIVIFQLAQILGWTPDRLHRLSQTEWVALTGELRRCGSLQRRRLFQKAFEGRLRTMALDVLARGEAAQPRPAAHLKFQAVFCIDAREESFRRHIEELEPLTETFGVAGFFGIPMSYRGIGEAQFVAQCPIVVTPRYWVVEEPAYSHQDLFQRRKQTRRAIGEAARHFHSGSHGLLTGAIIAAGLGALASVPLVGRILFPRLTGHFRRLAGSFIEEAPVSHLRLERRSDNPGPLDDGLGFSRQEMVDMSERLLRDIGLIDNFSRLVLLLGHGSSCLNNPHQSAYDCGACTGRAGGPNARAMAAMLNDLRVREQLARRGIGIPEETRFVAGEHNTTKDSVQLFDLDQLPASHAEELDTARSILAAACERNAHERCRRFYSAPLNLSRAAAHRHVAERAEDLAQTRPEFGNATNALCVVGRRDRTRGLFLDRRSFLVSYHPEQDDADLTILNRLLSAVVPVCAGINLQYTLAATDPAGWGSGSKLPHNVTSLLGVMDGAASDLRAGLPLQGVELHEPVRLLMVVEVEQAALCRLLERNPTWKRLVAHEWLQLATLSPTGSVLHRYAHGAFRPYSPSPAMPPTTCNSESWYRGRRDHLEFACIQPSAARADLTSSQQAAQHHACRQC